MPEDRLIRGSRMPVRDVKKQALAHILLTRDPEATRIRKQTRNIGRRLLDTSAHTREPNFTAIDPGDLAFLFAAYDARFMDGICGKLLGPDGVTFRLSSRMTRAGGKTTRFRRPDGAIRYEIAVAASILFDGFAAGDPNVTVCGLPCRHRLDALQRLFEHELVHLANGSAGTRATVPAAGFRASPTGFPPPGPHAPTHYPHRTGREPRDHRRQPCDVSLSRTAAARERQPDHQACYGTGGRSGGRALVRRAPRATPPV